MEKLLSSRLLGSARGGLILAALAWLAACSGAQGDIPEPPRVAPPSPPKAPLPPPASPIDKALPSIAAPPSLPQRASCRIGTCMLSNPVPEDLLKKLPEHGPILIWEQRIGNKSRMVFPPDKDVELAGVVLEGNVGLLPREKQWSGTPEMMTQWQGFYAPGGGVMLSTMDSNPVRLALVIGMVTDSADDSIAGHVRRWRKNMKPFEWKQRERALERIDFTSLPVVSWGQGAYHARIGWGVPGAPSGDPGPQGASPAAPPGAPSMVMSLLRFSEDAPIEAHVHEKERECLAFLEGDGELLLSNDPPGPAGAGQPGADPPGAGQLGTGPAGTLTVESVAVEPGMVACIPNGMWHSFKPSGKSPLLAIQVYAPPGPELQVKQLAGKVP